MKDLFKIIIVLLFILPSVLFSQSEKKLTAQLSAATQDSVKTRILLQLSQIGSARGDTTYHFELMQFCKEKLKNPSLDDSTHKILVNGLVQSLNGLGFLKQQSGDGKRAIVLWNELLKLEDKYKDKNVEAYTLLNIGYVNDHAGNLPVALELYHKALASFEQKKDVHGLGAVMNNLASLYNRQGDKEKAMEYYQKGLEIQKNNNNKLGSAYILDNLAGLYLEKGEGEKAKELWDKSLKLHSELKNKVGIGTIYYRFADLERVKKNYGLALEYMNKALILNEEVDNKMGIARGYNSLSKLYFETKEFQKAKIAGEKAYAIASQSKYPKELETISFVLARVYAGLGEYKKAYEMEVIHKQMSDTVSNENSRRLSMRKNFEYAFQKQAAQDSLKAAEAEKLFSAEIKHQKTQSMALYIGIGLIAIFSIFMYNRFRLTQKQKAIIEKQKAMVDEKQKEIIESMHYAKRIQKALMPSEKMIRRSLDALK